MCRKCRLDQDFSRALFAAGTASDLYDRLRHTFVAAKIGAEQTLIGVDYADKRQLRKVVTLGQHLRANEDVRFAERRQCERGVDGAFALHAVAVDSCHTTIRKTALQYILEPFRTLAQRLDRRPTD